MIKNILLIAVLFTFGFAYGVEGMIIKTTDHSYNDRWNKTLGKSVPKIMSADELFRGQDLFVGAAIVRYATNKNDEADLSYSIKIFNPKNELFFHQKDVTLIKTKIFHKEYVQLSDGFIKINLDEKNAFGTYRIEMTIVDHVAKSSVDLKTQFNLVVLPSYKNFTITENKNFSEWMENYYIKKEPEKALAYYIFFTKSEIAEQQDQFLPVFSFFSSILKDNPFLFNDFHEAYQKENDKTKNLLILLLYKSVNSEQFKMFFEDQELITNLKNTEFPDPYGEITHPNQLDMLWSTFYASGLQKPILHLIKTLDYAQFKGSLDAYKTSKKTEKDRENAMKDAMFGAAVWSLDSHCKSSDLVLNYANWILANEKLTETQKKELSNILKNFNE